MPAAHLAGRLTRMPPPAHYGIVRLAAAHYANPAADADLIAELASRMDLAKSTAAWRRASACAMIQVES